MKRKSLVINNSFFSGNAKERWQNLKKEGFTDIIATIPCSFKKNEDETFSVIISTEKMNDNGHKIIQNFDWSRYEKNPIVLDNHRQETVQDILGKIKDWKSENKITTGRLIMDRDSARGEDAFNKIKNDFLNALSIGLLPMRFDKDGALILSKVLEISLVPVPADEDTIIIRNCADCGTEEAIVEEKEEKEKEEIKIKEAKEEVEDVKEVKNGKEEILKNVLKNMIKEKEERENTLCEVFRSFS